VGAAAERGLTPERVDFLHARPVAYLATVDERGRPHALPVCFVCLDGRLYTPIDEKPKRGDPTTLRRLRNIRAHPDVCLTADRYDDDWTRLAWVQVRGVAALVDDADERERALAALRARYRPYRVMDLEARPLIRITPDRVIAWAADQGAGS
jgi:PPOX class probable F420-dependent enzyme